MEFLLIILLVIVLIVLVVKYSKAAKEFETLERNYNDVQKQLKSTLEKNTKYYNNETALLGKISQLEKEIEQLSKKKPTTRKTTTKKTTKKEEK